MGSKERSIKKIDFEKILEILKEDDQESVYEKTNITVIITYTGSFEKLK